MMHCPGQLRQEGEAITASLRPAMAAWFLERGTLDVYVNAAAENFSIRLERLLSRSGNPL
jgi:hypothetical protein